MTVTARSADPANLVHVGVDLKFSDDFEVREENFRRLERLLADAPVETREALRAFVSEGDEFQRRVVEAQDRTLRLVAPAGAGKTQTVIHRALARIRDGLSPTSILLLTFDNAAARSLRDKLAAELARLGVEGKVNGLTISTLNAFGYSAVLKQYFETEFKPLIEEQRQLPLFRQIKKELAQQSAERYALLPTGLRDRVFLELFGRLKNELFDPRSPDARRFAETILSDDDLQLLFFANVRSDDVEAGRSQMKLILQALLWLFEKYEQRLREEQLMDFDDQKLRAYQCLAQSPGVLAALQNGFREVVVDEFQDINVLDFELIKMVAARATLIITGDDDQAIYGFRGCSPKFIIELETHLGRPVRSYELQKNYRCPPNIVEYADRLIRHNTWRIPKEPIPERTTPSQVKVVSSLGAGLEARWLVSLIRRVREGAPTLSYSDFAVLYRTNSQSLPPQVEFILNDIPYHVPEEHNILRNESLERLLGVLRLKLAIEAGRAPDVEDCVRTTAAYFRTLSAQRKGALRHVFYERRHVNFFELINTAEFADALQKEGSNFPGAIAELLTLRDLSATLEFLASKFKGLKAMVGSLEEVADDRVPLGEIYEIAANFKNDIAAFVATIENALERARIQGAGHREEDGVALRTYFRSKGLQWHTVVLIGCNEGIIPHKRTLAQKLKLEEERRLFYVGMTRASSNLVISYLRNVVKGAVVPSRFLSEAGLV